MNRAMPETTQAIDPVCGMTVDPATAAGNTEFAGKTFTSAIRVAKANSRQSQRDISRRNRHCSLQRSELRSRSRRMITATMVRLRIAGPVQPLAIPIQSAG
jgi:hypothetical protein